MSWDIFIYDFPKDAKTPADIPNDWKPPAIGTAAEITAKIKQVVPNAIFSKPGEGVIEGKGYAIEVSIGTNEPLTGVTLFVHGGEGAVQTVSAIVSHLGLRAINTGSGGFFEPGPKAVEGYRHWAAYRDYVISQHSSPPIKRPLLPFTDILIAFVLATVLALIWHNRHRFKRN